MHHPWLIGHCELFAFADFYLGFFYPTDLLLGLFGVGLSAYVALNAEARDPEHHVARSYQVPHTTNQ